MVATFVASPQSFNYDMIPVAAAALVMVRHSQSRLTQFLAPILWIAPVLVMPLNALHVPLIPLVLAAAGLQIDRILRAPAEGGAASAASKRQRKPTPARSPRGQRPGSPVLPESCRAGRDRVPRAGPYCLAPALIMALVALGFVDVVLRLPRGIADFFYGEDLIVVLAMLLMMSGLYLVRPASADPSPSFLRGWRAAALMAVAALAVRLGRRARGL